MNDRRCESTGRRKAPPDDRLREAIQSNKQELDCFVASAPRNDVDKFGYNFAISPRIAREF
jgi:hypothetical protein